MAHFSTVIADLADRYGERIALRDRHGEMTYSAFAAEIFRFGSGLLALGELSLGDRVAILLPDIREYLLADYGIMCAGLVRVPLDPRLAEAELAAQLTLAEVRAVITDRDGAARLAAAMPDVDLVVVCVSKATGVSQRGYLGFDEVIAAGSANRPEGGSKDDLAALNFSGGSTGRPKATMIPHRTFAAVLETVPKAFKIHSDDIFLNVRPLWPIAQVVAMAYLGAGAILHLSGKFRPETFAEAVRDSGATRSSLVPTQLVRLLDHIETDEPHLATLTAIHVGGSRLPPAAFHNALSRIGARIGILYGLTEAPVTTYLAPEEFAAARSAADIEALMGASGTVLDGYDVMLGGGGGDGDGVLGPSGEVMIRGPHVMDGYLKEPELTAQALEDGWLHTNDLGAFDADGRLHIVGRLKDVIRSGASSILPKEVEDALATNPHLEDVAVVGIPDVEWGEIVVAFAVRKPGSAIKEREVIDSCDPSLARFKRPKQVHFVNEIPRSHYGKVLRPQLLARLTDTAPSGA